ncbi:MAG TPA: hypothetical protein PLV25_05905, partial [Opitutales bacterium]|nr:hypothetical protein [Opitutales bacterium]
MNTSSNQAEASIAKSHNLPRSPKQKPAVQGLLFLAFFIVLFLSFYSNFFKVANWPYLLKARIDQGNWEPKRDWFETY